MDSLDLARIRQSPAFKSLERERRMLSWSLAVGMMALYAGFLLVVAFDPGLAARPIGGGPLTLAFPLGLGVILAAIVLTGAYVWRANTRFDTLTSQIVRGEARP